MSAKRLLSTLLLFAITAIAWAQHWTAPDEHAYPEETPIYVQVLVNGNDYADLELAAFIDGECRAVASSAELKPITGGGKHLFSLRVWGDKEDMNKTITFKAFKNGVVYKFKKTAVFDGETDSRAVPFILNLDLINRVGLEAPRPIVLEGPLPITYDLGEKIIFGYEYGGHLYEPLGESEPDTDETTFTYVWTSVDASSKYFTVDADNILHATANTLTAYPLHLNLLANGERVADFETRVIVRGEIVDVEGIVVTNPELEVSYGTPYEEIFGGPHGFQVKMIPDNATNQDWRVEPAEEGETPFEEYDGNLIATKPGTYTYKIISDENPDFQTLVQLRVVDDRRIEVSPLRLEIPLGTPIEEVFGGPNGFQVAVLPENTPDKEWDFYLQQPFDDVPFDEDADENFVAVTPGLYTYRIALVRQRDIYQTVELYIQKPVNFDTPRELTLSRLYDTDVAFTNLTGDAFDPGKVEMTFSLAPGNLVSVLAEGSGLEWKMRGLQVGTYNCYVTYDGVGKGYFPVHVPAEMQMESGWSWFAPTFVEPGSRGQIRLVKDNNWLAWMQNTPDHQLIEMRSQTALLYNDPEDGFFGDLEDMRVGQMYKVKVEGTPIYINMGDTTISMTTADPVGPMLRKGYNWLGYPYTGYRTVEDLNLLSGYNTLQDGMMLIGKDGFAEYDGMMEEWMASKNFLIEEGKGYIAYFPEEVERNTLFCWGQPRMHEEVFAEGKAEKVASKTVSPFRYDASLYPDNMAIVAQIPGALHDTQSLTLGAFVGDECRGQGTFVKDDLLMINVAGKAGEKITFRLYDSHSDTYTQLPETLTHTLRAGSLKAPVQLTAPVETALQGVQDEATSHQIYDLSGRRVVKMQKGIYIKKGRIIKN